MLSKVPLFDRIGKMLQTSDITFYVTRSALDELGNLPNDDDNIFSDARQFGLDECEIIERSGTSNHGDDPKRSPSTDIQHLVANGNKNGYFVATQDKGLSDALRDMDYVPQMWLTKGVLIFDTPSAVSRRASQNEEREKQKTGGGTMTKEESQLIRQLRRERANKRSENNDQNMDERKKRKAKGPNPLSCKKRKTQVSQNAAESTKRKRRRRKVVNDNK